MKEHELDATRVSDVYQALVRAVLKSQHGWKKPDELNATAGDGVAFCRPGDKDAADYRRFAANKRNNMASSSDRIGVGATAGGATGRREGA